MPGADRDVRHSIAHQYDPRKRPGLIRRLGSVFKDKVDFLEIVPPTPSAHRRDLAVVIIARNAAARLAEWIDFHLLAGVEHVYFYDDHSSDGTAQVTAPYVAGGQVTVVPWHLDVVDSDSGRWSSRQMLAYAHAVQTFGGDWRHMAFLDDDEFLVPTGEHDLRAVLADLGHPSNLSLPWHMFGFNGHETIPPGSVVENYTRRSVVTLEKAVVHFKCIIDPAKVFRVAIHEFETTDLGSLTMNTLGHLIDRRKRRSYEFITGERIQLNHYYTRSRAELQQKIDRGSANDRRAAVNRARVLRHVEAIERETVEDRKALEFLARVGSIT